MRRAMQCLMCALAVGCGSEPTAEPAVAPTATEPAPAEPAPTEPAPAEPAPAPTPTPGPAVRIAGHFLRAKTALAVPAGTDLSSPPEGVTLDIDEARMGTEEELAAPPFVTIYAELAPDAAPPIAALSTYGEAIHVAAGAGCHLGVSREIAPITADASPRVVWTLVELCPLTDLDGAVTQVGAWAPGEDLGVGETNGVFLSIGVSLPVAPLFVEGGIAIDAPGIDYVLLQQRADEDAPEVLRFAVSEGDAAATLASFAGRPLEIERP